jgi:rhodanese-related sulfurtransferase
MKYLLISLFFLNSCSFFFSEDNLKTVKANIDSGKAVLIDTRSQREWDQGHVKGAKRFEVKDIRKMKEEKKLEENIPKDKIIYTHCMAGIRAKIAAEVLKERGYDVRPLKEGYPDLIKAGFQKE